MTRSYQLLLAAILILAFGLRLGASFTTDPLAPYDRGSGGDEWWYLEYGFRQVTDEALDPVSTAPLYLLLVGSVRYTLSPERTDKADKYVLVDAHSRIKSVAGAPSALAVRILQAIQAILSTATVYFAFRMGHTLTGDPRAGLVTAGVLATSVALVITSTRIVTETTYLFFLTAAIMVYLEQVAGERTYRYPVLVSVIVGGLLGAATLTRAVLLLFPLGIAAHMIFLLWITNPLALRWRGVLALLITVIAFNSLWTGYYYLRWGEVVVGAKGMTAFFYLGAQGGWQGAAETDTALGVQAGERADAGVFTAGAQAIIQADPTGYVQTRIRNLTRAYAQPYGTVAFPGESIRNLALDWWRTGPSLQGGVALLQAEAFWPKLMIYLVHYGGLVFGLAGVLLTWRRWQLTTVILGLIAYVTLLHLVLLALPRYLFPLLPFWWVLAGAAITRGWGALRQQVTSSA